MESTTLSVVGLQTEVSANQMQGLVAARSASMNLQSLRDLLTRSYLDQSPPLDTKASSGGNYDLLNLVSFSEIRFRKSEDLHTGMQALLTAISRYQLPFVYILHRTSQGIYSLYMGLWGTDAQQTVNLQDVFNAIPASVRGFLPGCRCENVTRKRSVWRHISELDACRVLTGIPSVKQVSQPAKDGVAARPLGIEKLADSSDYPFAVVVHATPIADDVQDAFRQSVESCANTVHRHTKISHQAGQNRQQSTGESITHTTNSGTSQSHSNSDGTTVQNQTLSGPKTILDNLNKTWRGGQKSTHQLQRTTSVTAQSSEGTSDAWGSNTSTTHGDSLTHSIEEIEKAAQSIEAILDRHLKRFEQGKGAGFWHCLTSVFADTDVHADEIANLFRGMVSGEASGDDPVRVLRVPQRVTLFNASDIVLLDDSQPHPFGYTSPVAHSLTKGVFTQLNTRELSLLASLPQHELPGIFVEELVEYGRNWLTRNAANESRGIDLGQLIDRNYTTDNLVHLSREKLQRHCFISGATGSGKTTTVKHLLRHLWCDCHIPFLVIEPVKSEYHSLSREFGSDLHFFRLGSADFSLNPFEFEQGLPLSSHLDMLKATCNASLGMYSSMPFVLEHILYKVYEDRGWDLLSGENACLPMLKQAGFTDENALRQLCFPLLGDTTGLVRQAIGHFFGSQQTDYSGSLTGALHARLSSLVHGIKGHVLNRSASMSFDKLLTRPCIIELSNFADNDEKAFIMALLMTRLYEHRQAEERAGVISPNTLRHVLVIEEAHRLLAKPTPSGEHSAQGRQKGVEVFADILAEIRSYGQGLVIVDQIPSKLVPDVLRNTDIKIAHRIVDKEDRELMGATMNLDEKQVRELARMIPGESCLYFSGLRKALCVKIGAGTASIEEMSKSMGAAGHAAEAQTERNDPVAESISAAPARGRALFVAAALLCDAGAMENSATCAQAGDMLRGCYRTGTSINLENAWRELQEGMFAIGHMVRDDLACGAKSTLGTDDPAADFTLLCEMLCTLGRYAQALIQGQAETAYAMACKLRPHAMAQPERILPLLVRRAHQHAAADPGIQNLDIPEAPDPDSLLKTLTSLRGTLPAPRPCATQFCIVMRTLWPQALPNSSLFLEYLIQHLAQEVL